jgi:hypothetical protein
MRVLYNSAELMVLWLSCGKKVITEGGVGFSFAGSSEKSGLSYGSMRGFSKRSDLVKSFYRLIKEKTDAWDGSENNKSMLHWRRFPQLGLGVNAGLGV